MEVRRRKDVEVAIVCVVGYRSEAERRCCHLFLRFNLLKHGLSHIDFRLVKANRNDCVVTLLVENQKSVSR